MDMNYIEILKDKQASSEKCMEALDKKIKSYDKTNKSLMDIKNLLQILDNNISQMKQEIYNLQNEENRNEWKEKRSKLKSKSDEYKETINNLELAKFKKKGNDDSIDNVDHLDPDAKVDHNKLTAQQEMDRGNAIMNRDDEILAGAAQTLDGDVKVIIDTNKILDKNEEKIDKVNADLKEIDFSIGRARQTITNMFKLYASDKLITCLIVVILLIIVTIIIVSACGGDNKNNFNVPHDVFDTNNKTNTNIKNSSNYLYFPINFILFISIIFYLV